MLCRSRLNWCLVESAKAPKKKQLIRFLSWLQSDRTNIAWLAADRRTFCGLFGHDGYLLWHWQGYAHFRGPISLHSIQPGYLNTGYRQQSCFNARKKWGVDIAVNTHIPNSHLKRRKLFNYYYSGKRSYTRNSTHSQERFGTAVLYRILQE